MTTLDGLLIALLLSSLIVVGYTYVGYPALLWSLSRLFGRAPRRPIVTDSELPTVTLVVAAYNEERHIRERIENALQTDYPTGKFDVIIASDGSTDQTASIVHEYSQRGVELADFPMRRGKPAVLNDVVPAARGEIVMLSDANTITNQDAARCLAAWFTDPSVGSVSGRLVLTDPEVGRNVDSMYWKYETFLKKCESRLGAVLGANGGIYAVRKSAFVPIPNNTLVDDLVIPLLAREQAGHRIVYDRDAVACEETPDRMMSEFHRRARIGAGGYQAIGMLRGLLGPRHGWIAFTFWSHKVLRWLGPFFLVLGFIANLGLIMSANPTIQFWGATVMLGQLGFYLAAIAGGVVPSRPRALRILRVPTLFTLLNAALAVGFFRWATGRQAAAWRRTERTSPGAEA